MPAESWVLLFPVIVFLEKTLCKQTIRPDGLDRFLTAQAELGHG